MIRIQFNFSLFSSQRTWILLWVNLTEVLKNLNMWQILITDHEVGVSSTSFSMFTSVVFAIDAKNSNGYFYLL